MSRGVRLVPFARAAAVLIVALVAAAACAPVSARPDAGRSAVTAATPPDFSFARDTFAFPNMIRARHRDGPGLYANYCFVMARAVRQFFVAARFEPDAPKLDHAGYAERVRQVIARVPWGPGLPPAERVVIPGYANLRDLSRAEEAAVKRGLGPRFWTWVHWTNWRVTFPVTRGRQATVAREIVDELREGRLVQLLITNWPKPELNHTVVVFAFREVPAGVELEVSDPNDPASAGLITFDRARRRFEATRVYDTEPGVIRVFRMYYSWLW